MPVEPSPEGGTDGVTEVFTDGACRGNPGPGGWGAVLEYGDSRKTLHGGERVIDVGTGSGILAIGAALLGAKSVLAIDIDPTAVKVAQENIEHNHLSDKIRAVEGNLLEKTDESCDVCVANIIADVICFFAKPLTSHIVPGGKFICSGIIKERENDVVAALTEAGYTIEEIRRKGEWVAIRAGRN